MAAAAPKSVADAMKDNVPVDTAGLHHVQPRQDLALQQAKVQLEVKNPPPLQHTEPRTDLALQQARVQLEVANPPQLFHVDPPRASPKPWVRQQYLADRWPFGLGWGRMITDFLDSDFFTDPFYDVPPVRSQQPSDGKQQAGPLSLWGNSSTLPSVDVVEREKDYILQVDLPGVKRADIKVTVDDRHGDKILTVSGERRENMHEDDKAKGFRTWSRSYGSFSRSLALPKHVDSHGITAKHEDGVLKVTIPKLAIAPQPVKEIAVQH